MVTLINEGRSGKNLLEKVADIILIPSKILWYGKDLKLIKTDNTYKITDEYSSKGLIPKEWAYLDKRADEGGPGPGIWFLFIGVFTLLTAIPALISLARLYQDVVFRYLKYKKAKKESDNLDNKIESIQLKINSLNNINGDLDKYIRIYTSIPPRFRDREDPKVRRNKNNEKISNMEKSKSDLERRKTETEKKTSDLYNRLFASINGYDKEHLDEENTNINLKIEILYTKF